MLSRNEIIKILKDAEKLIQNMNYAEKKKSPFLAKIIAFNNEKILKNLSVS